MEDPSAAEAMERALAKAHISNSNCVQDQNNIFHEFSTKIMDIPVFYNVSKLGRTLYLWIGGQDRLMDDLSYSATTPYDKGLPSSTQILGNSGETTSTALAARLASKLQKPVYLSYNLATRDGVVINGIETRLMEEIRTNPDKF